MKRLWSAAALLCAVALNIGQAFAASYPTPLVGLFDTVSGKMIGLAPDGVAGAPVQTPMLIGADTEQPQFQRAGAVHSAKSIAAARLAYDTSTLFTENWTDTSAWGNGGATATQVSAGKLYGGSAPGGTSGLNHAFVASAQGLYAVVTVNHVTGGGGGVIVGVSSDAAGAAPTAGGGAAFGLYIRGSNTTPQQISSGTFSDLTTEPTTTAGTYIVTVSVDATYISVVAYQTSTGATIRTRRLRAGFNVNNLYVFNSCTTALSGQSIGTVSGRQALASTASEVNQRVLYSGDGTNDWQLWLPSGFDSRAPVPLVIGFHGNGSDQNHWATNANGIVVKDALVGAGYAFLGVTYAANKSTWGAQASLDAYVAAYNWARKFVPIESVSFYANSMGGIESELTLADRRIPGVVAWVGTSPTANLADNYTGGGGQFTAVINTAYGITDPSQYAAATAGHDPALLSPAAFRGLPMLFLAATDDTTVSKANNADLLASRLTRYSNVTLQTGITGGHSFNFAPYTSQIVSFFDAARLK